MDVVGDSNEQEVDVSHTERTEAENKLNKEWLVPVAETDAIRSSMNCVNDKVDWDT